MDDKIYLLDDKICSNILMGRGILPKIKDCIDQCESDTDTNKSYYIRLNQCLAEIEQYIKIYKDFVGVDYVYDHDHSYGYFAKIVNKEKTDTESESKSNNNEDTICVCDPVDRDLNAFYDGEIHYNYQSILTAKINRNNDI